MKLLHLASALFLSLSTLVARADIAFLPVALRPQADKAEAALLREATSQLAEKARECQSLENDVSFKRRINVDLVLFEVRPSWEDRACLARLPKACQAIYSLKDGLVDLSCSEGDDGFE